MSKSDEHILSVDTGKHFAAALISHQSGKVELTDMYYQHEECFMSKDVADLARNLGEMIARHGVHPDSLAIVLELPSHRYFGRGNSSALLKAFWQGLRLAFKFASKGVRVIPIPANEWNKQRDDAKKKRAFKHTFETEGVPYYEQKHGGRSNNHERDAALIGKWAAKRMRMGLPFSFN